MLNHLNILQIHQNHDTSPIHSNLKHILCRNFINFSRDNEQVYATILFNPAVFFLNQKKTLSNSSEISKGTRKKHLR